MRCGLYGKLPPKRDFIALYAPRQFLGVWEPWMQASVSSSRQRLSEGWQQAFLTAPIWRFWLGADICGAAVMGAFMSSLDGIGRYFPLTLFACADGEAALPPPELNAQDAWFDAAEDLLLSTLEENATFEAASAALDALPPPSDRVESAPATIPMTRTQGMLAIPSGSQPFPELFEAMRVVDYAGVYAAASFWWTIGGEGYEPLALGGKGMPDPIVFADMLTGRLATESAFGAGA